MKVKLLLVGKSVEDWLQSGIILYTSRLKHYVPFEMTVIPELKQTSALCRTNQGEGRDRFLPE